jgi:hypothetical protein
VQEKIAALRVKKAALAANGGAAAAAAPQKAPRSKTVAPETVKALESTVQRLLGALDIPGLPTARAMQSLCARLCHAPSFSFWQARLLRTWTY